MNGHIPTLLFGEKFYLSCKVDSIDRGRYFDESTRINCFEKFDRALMCLVMHEWLTFIENVRCILH